jgi:hypothetical protein
LWIAAMGYVGRDCIDERAGKSRRTGFSQRAGQLTESGDSSAKVSG